MRWLSVLIGRVVIPPRGMQIVGGVVTRDVVCKLWRPQAHDVNV